LSDTLSRLLVESIPADFFRMGLCTIIYAFRQLKTTPTPAHSHKSLLIFSLCRQTISI
jgi:hypothetical protein